MVKKYLGISLILVSVTSCTTYQKALKSTDNAYKIAVANDLFEQNKMSKAINLYEDVEKSDGWKPNNQLMFVNYAKAMYKNKRYEPLTGLLRKFNASYPTSVFREEMLFLEAKTLYHRTEPYNKDQALTNDAIEKFNQYVAEYPESERIEEVQKNRKELQNKIEQKAFENAKLYNSIGEYTRDYNAAIVALDNFIQDYPGSDFKEDALYYKFDSAYQLAINSVYSKMEERLNTAIRYYNALISFNEKTKYKNQAEKMLARLENELKQFPKNQ